MVVGSGVVSVESVCVQVGIDYRDGKITLNLIVYCQNIFRTVWRSKNVGLCEHFEEHDAQRNIDDKNQ